jgi:hypothetical protein
MDGAHLHWALGGEATVLAASADTISLLSTTPSPPGSRIDGMLTSGRPLRVKVHASKRQADGLFRIDGRPLDLTKEGREELAALVSPGARP